jgi:hypothetical protein
MMNTLKNTIIGLTYSVGSTLTKISAKKLPQQVLFLLTGFLVSQFFLLNILYSQHPQGGWVTFFGNISTTSLIAIVLLAIIACLIALWRSATDTTSSRHPQRRVKRKTRAYSKPATFMSVSPE